MLWLVALLVSVAVFFGYMLIIRSATRKEILQNRLNRLSAEASSSSAATETYTYEDERSSTASLLAGVLAAVGVSVEKVEKRMAPQFARAGIMTTDGATYMIFLKRLGFPLIGILLAIPIFLQLDAPGTSSMMRAVYFLLLIFCALIAVKGADVLLLNRIQKRKQVLERSFPDALDLMLVCVESGLALDGALARVTRELGRAHPEITNELNRTRLELTLLNDRTQALQNLAERTDLVAFRSLAATLIQTEKFGTSLADTLRVLSEDYRISRLMDAENRAGRLPVLITIPLVVMMMPAFFLIILGPPIIRVIEQGGLFGR